MLFSCARRKFLLVFIVVFLILMLGLRHDEVRRHVPVSFFSNRPPSPAERLRTLPQITREDVAATHLLLPVTSTQSSTCKTLMTAAILGYPVPTLIGWNTTHAKDKLIGGGRYVTKIGGILEWLEAQPETSDDEIVMIVDAYGGFNHFKDRKGIESHVEGDVWFQLPVEVLLARYRAIIDRSNEDLAVHLGRVYDAEKIRQKIVFGSSKRCTPNSPEVAACYPIPQSPLPDNLYGKQTDSQPTPTESEGLKTDPLSTPIPVAPSYENYRQRYLSAGYIIGPIGPMRALFHRAQDKFYWDANLADGGSDQAIFQRIFGEQEFQREAMRRRYGEPDRRPYKVGGLTVDNVLNPSFWHESLEPKRNGREDEFGISVDYWSDLAMQTTDNADDGRWLRYEQPIQEQLLARPRQPASCTPYVSGELPVEVVNSTSLPRAAVSDASQFSPFRGWDEIPLYTNVCLDTIPAVVSHTGDQQHRLRDWPEHWIQPHGRRLIEEILDRGEGGTEERGGAYVGVGGKYHEWADLCPASLDKELFDD